MEEEDSRLDLLSNLLVFSLVSTLVLGMSLFIYVVYHDYIMYNLLNIVTTLFDDGIISVDWYNSAESVVNLINLIPQIFDFLWLVVFISLVWELVYIAYRTSRQGYFDMLSYMGYGVMIFLFALSIVKQISDWLYDFFFNQLLQNITVEMTFFTFYMDNIFIIKTILLMLMILINYVDFNNFKFNQRKKQEMSDEI